MNYRLMFTLNAIVAAVFGAAFLAAPQPIFQFFGASDAYTSTQALARFFGGTLVVVAALLWFLKDSGKELMKTEAFTMMIAAVGGAVLTVMELMSQKSVLRTNGWIPLVIYILLAIGYAYIIFGVTVKVKGKK